MGEATNLLAAETQLPYFKERKKSPGIGWVSAYVVVASLVEISRGAFVSMTGPMLQFLVINTRSSVDLVAGASSGAAIGMCLGSAAFSAIKNAVDYKTPLLSSGITVIVIAVADICTPFVHSVTLLVILYTVSGFMCGYSVSELQSVYLTRWGQVESRPFIQLHHLMFSFGCVLAPLTAKPFLEMASLRHDPISTCPHRDKSDAVLLTVNNGTRIIFQDDGFNEISNPITWCFFIVGAFSFLVSILCFILTVCKIDDHLIEYIGNRAVSESRPDGMLKDLWMFFVTVILFKFCVVSSEMIYQGFIYSIAICSHLKMDVTHASLLNSLFWGGFVLGRLSCVIMSKYIKPSTILKVNFALAAFSLVIMSYWGERVHWITWAVTFMFAFSVASMFPTGVCWCSEVTNMTGKYIFVFATGGTLGWSITQPVAGTLFENNPFSVVYFVTGICIANIAFYILMGVTANCYLKKNVE